MRFVLYYWLMAQVMDIYTAQRQMHIKDNPGYVMTDAFVASSFDSPPDIEAAWETEIARRRQEVLDGTVKLVDGEEVFRRLMSKYA